METICVMLPPHHVTNDSVQTLNRPAHTADRDPLQTSFVNVVTSRVKYLSIYLCSNHIKYGFIREV